MHANHEASVEVLVKKHGLDKDCTKHERCVQVPPPHRLRLVPCEVDQQPGQ